MYGKYDSFISSTNCTTGNKRSRKIYPCLVTMQIAGSTTGNTTGNKRIQQVYRF